ncbi:MAG: DUF1622 domain-containing protein [Acidobacteriota bacterium]
MTREPPDENWASWLIPVALILGLVLLLRIPVDPVGQASMDHAPLDGWLKLLVGYLAAGAEIAAALVIGIAIFKGFLAYSRQFFVQDDPRLQSSEAIRLRLGRALALGLEFTVASDILHTAVSPTHQDIMNLGAIVLLRSLLNYFLEREIRQGEVH